MEKMEIMQRLQAYGCKGAMTYRDGKGGVPVACMTMAGGQHKGGVIVPSVIIDAIEAGGRPKHADICALFDLVRAS